MNQLEEHKCEPGEVLRLKGKAQEMIDDPKVDSRTKSHLIKFLIEHDFDVYKHENPAVQKHELSGDLNLSIADKIRALRSADEPKGH